MGLKDLLVLMDGPANVAVSYAVSLAGAFDAHLTGADVGPPVRSDQRVPRFVVEQQLADAQREREARSAAFLERAQGGAVTAETVAIASIVDDAARQFAILARHFDLTVLAQPDPDTVLDDAMLEAALFGSGRPVMMVPSVHRAPARLDRIMVAWDRSEVAARAIAGALPILKRAKLVQVVTVDRKPPETVDHPGFNIARHLARHKIPTELKVVTTTIDIANTLLSLVADEGTDMLVMGAYGHSRLRERILGGATRGVLQSMTVPVLMAH
jgi:nucleotide-binding universal stress UspA family protein